MERIEEGTHTHTHTQPSITTVTPPVSSKCYWSFIIATESRFRKIKRALGPGPRVTQEESGKPHRTPASRRLERVGAEPGERLSSDQRPRADSGERAGRLLSLHESAAQRRKALLPEGRNGLGAVSPPLAHHADPPSLLQQPRWPRRQSLAHSNPHPLHP